ncbi:MAG TPA: NADH-quinone oxidoreductase subunit L [Gaiellaceae bacterium]
MIAACAWICLLAPLAAVLVIALGGNRLSRCAAGYLATGSTVIAFAAAVTALLSTLGHSASQRQTVTTAFGLIETHALSIKLALLADPISLVMMLVVSGVGSLIIAYSIGYMKGEGEERRYFAYIAFFVFSMLLLVEAANFFILLVGWGLVGLSSYLLIGFWHERPSAVAAAKKAFIINAVGDAAMALSLFLLIQHAHTLDFAGVFGQAVSLGENSWLINLVAAGLLLGAIAKSAQIPLHTWLPDAMEGPTPVSALIHAATMVTAGVYLIVRTYPLFEQAPHVQQTAAGLGAVTLLATGLVALVQTDIKRVIAYSTMSQIGYMFLAAGIGAYGAAMFHLVTHAFFKALLFLAAGVVIHALGGEQDMRKMGGLRKRMPRTFIAMLIGTGALAGLPLLSGFFSKDAILAAAVSGGIFDKLLFAAGIAGVLLTALYSFRLLFLVFSGEESELVRKSLAKHKGPEGPRWMTVPVGLLALLAVAGGWMQIAGLWHPFSTFLEVTAPTFAYEPSALREWLLSAVSVGITLGGIWIAWAIYSARTQQVPRAPKALVEKLYFDRAYDRVFYRPAVWLAQRLGSWFERPVIERSGEEIGLGALGGGRISAAIQNGLARTYVLLVAAGASLIVLLFLVLR